MRKLTCPECGLSGQPVVFHIEDSRICCPRCGHIFDLDDLKEENFGGEGETTGECDSAESHPVEEKIV